MPNQWLAVSGVVGFSSNERVVGQVCAAATAVVPLPHGLLEPQSTRAALAAVSAAFIGSEKVTVTVELSAPPVVAALGSVEATVGTPASAAAVATFERKPMPLLLANPTIA